MEYYKNKNGILYNGDCDKMLELIEDKSQQAIIIDPPYNIGKDFWDIIDDYYNWLGDIIEKSKEEQIFSLLILWCGIKDLMKVRKKDLWMGL